jgi:hypothetical protein
MRVPKAEMSTSLAGLAQMVHSKAA